MKRPESLTDSLVWALLACAIGFCAYLYPLPQTAVEEALSRLSVNVDSAVRDYIEVSTWRAWTTNAALFLTGLTSSIIWILGSESPRKRWASVAIAAIFAMLCLFIIGARAISHDSPIQYELSFLRQVSSAGSWRYVGAELHRLVSSIVSVLAFVSMFLVATKGKKAKTQE
jgi:hypothetical protein